LDATILPEILLTLTVPTVLDTNVTETIPAVAFATVVLPWANKIVLAVKY
jgi:hypothetical protein